MSAFGGQADPSPTPRLMPITRPRADPAEIKIRQLGPVHTPRTPPGDYLNSVRAFGRGLCLDRTAEIDGPSRSQGAVARRATRVAAQGLSKCLRSPCCRHHTSHQQLPRGIVSATI